MVAERLIKVGLVGLALSVASGCAGARTTIVADEAQFPISLSRGVRDEEGRIVSNERIAKVGSVHETTTAWGMLYSAVKLTPRTDISETVNSQVLAVGGDAVINLRVKSGQCAFDFIPIFTALPFWPGCVNIVVEGDIIKVRAGTAATAQRSARSAGVRVSSMEAVR